MIAKNRKRNDRKIAKEKNLLWLSEVNVCGKSDTFDTHTRPFNNRVIDKSNSRTQKNETKQWMLMRLLTGIENTQTRKKRTQQFHIVRLIFLSRLQSIQSANANSTVVSSIDFWFQHEKSLHFHACASTQTTTKWNWRIKKPKTAKRQSKTEILRFDFFRISNFKRWKKEEKYCFVVYFTLNTKSNKRWTRILNGF